MNSLFSYMKTRQENKMMKDEFSASYMKTRQNPTNIGLINLIVMKKGMPF